MDFINQQATIKYVRVALKVPLDRLFEYQLPESWHHNINQGSLVLVPFGETNKLVVAVVIEQVSRPSFAGECKQVAELLADRPNISNFVINTVRWVASYYQAKFGELLLSCLPKVIRTNKPAPAITENTAKFYEVANFYKPSSYPLTSEQQHIVTDISKSLDVFKVLLIDGITGSGKTEVYLQAIQLAIATKKQVLVLVPEIGLAPQIVERIQARFNIDIACWHSGLSDKQRYTAWYNCHNETSGVVVATRSGVFTSLPKLGLIIVDEEHDISYKHQNNPRYNARDIAVWLANKVSCPIILGSATPSLESYYNVEQHKYYLYRLTKRTKQASLPSCQLIDIRGKYLESGIAKETADKITNHLASGNQVIILLNRRGYANSALCHCCGKVVECLQCDAAMILHKNPAHMRCHHCDFQTDIPNKCSACGSCNIHFIGYGTEKIETNLQHLFNNYKVIRVDRDSVTKKNNIKQLAKKLAEPKPCIIVGTQMLAKGHHWPHITLVVILNIDSGLFAEDFRALERTAQLITQASGRAGRDKKHGEVLVQTYHPDNSIFNILKNCSYYEYAKTLMQSRQYSCFPPYVSMVTINVEAKKNQDAIDLLNEIKNIIVNFSATNKLVIDIFGPLEANLAKKGGFYRHLIILKAKRRILQKLLSSISSYIKKKHSVYRLRCVIDVDPYEVY
jgi:primosomal protein N' (replication factor Y)